MKFITLKSGREVGVRRIDIVETGRGYLEGQPEYIIKRILAKQHDELANDYGAYRPISVDDSYLTSEDPGVTLEGYRVFLDLVSFQPTLNQKNMHQSRLGFVFYHETVVTIEEVFNRVINHLDWENQADNISYEDF